MTENMRIEKGAFEFFFGLIGVFNHLSFFTEKLWKKVNGFDDVDEAEVKCAFMSLWARQHLGIISYPVGASWSSYNGDKVLYDEYINHWKPVFMAYEEWINKSR